MMAKERTPKEVWVMLDSYLKARCDLGFWKSILDLILEPQNPFEPQMRRTPKRGFVLVILLLGLPLGAFAYFNFWS